MAKIYIPYNPDLTKEKALELFKNHFENIQEPREVYLTALWGADLVVKKSGWTGVAIKIKHKGDKTFLRFNGFAPSAGVRLFLNGIIPMIILSLTSWKKLIKEVTAFIENDPVLQGSVQMEESGEEAVVEGEKEF